MPFGATLGLEWDGLGAARLPVPRLVRHVEEFCMEFSEVLAKRRSVRHFNAKLDVSEEDIRALIEAAVVAPTAGNIQPWRFTVVRSIDARERLSAALRQRWATGAPVVIVVSVDPRPCAARYADRGERLYAIQDTAAAVENILLAAVDRGLASCWVGAFDTDAVREAIGVQSPVEPVAVLPIGYSAESAGRPARRPLSEVATWI
jgi:nitroreductase